MLSCTSSMVAMSLLLFVIDQGWSPSGYSPPPTLQPCTHTATKNHSTPLVSIPYHLYPNTTSPIPSTTLTSTHLPSHHLTSRQSYGQTVPRPPHPLEAGQCRTVLQLPPRPHTTPVGYSSPHCSCGLLVPIPLLWATCLRTAPVGSLSPYRSCGLLVPIPLLWATRPCTAPEGYSAARGHTALQCWD